MGLLGDWMKSKKINDPVRGTLHVTASSRPPNSATSANFVINGIVSASGLMPTAVEHQGIARTRKWPRAGQVLPITVDRSDPTRIRIEWDEVPDTWDAARDNAERVARSMRTGSQVRRPAAQPDPGGGMVFQTGSSTSIDATAVPGLREEIMRIATTHVNDPATAQQLIHATLVERGVLNPDGSPGPAATVTASAGGPVGGPTVGPVVAQTQDPAARLRALQQLRKDGLVTEAEYDRLRAQILTEL